MKIAGIVLIILEIIALYTGINTGTLVNQGIPFYIGYLLPGIVGIVLFIKGSKKSKDSENSKKKM